MECSLGAEQDQPFLLYQVRYLYISYCTRCCACTVLIVPGAVPVHCTATIVPGTVLNSSCCTFLIYQVLYYFNVQFLMNFPDLSSNLPVPDTAGTLYIMYLGQFSLQKLCRYCTRYSRKVQVQFMPYQVKYLYSSCCIR